MGEDRLPGQFVFLFFYSFFALEILSAYYLSGPFLSTITVYLRWRIV